MLCSVFSEHKNGFCNLSIFGGYPYGLLVPKVDPQMMRTNPRSQAGLGLSCLHKCEPPNSGDLNVVNYMYNSCIIMYLLKSLSFIANSWSYHRKSGIAHEKMLILPSERRIVASILGSSRQTGQARNGPLVGLESNYVKLLNPSKYPGRSRSRLTLI